AAAALADNRENLAGGDTQRNAVNRGDVATIGRKRHTEIGNANRLAALLKRAHERPSKPSTSTMTSSRLPPGTALVVAVAGAPFALWRVRRRGSARSLRLSPTSVIPRTTSTIARPGKIDVHQIPLVTSAI